MNSETDITAILSQVDAIGETLNQLSADGKYITKDELNSVVTQVQEWSNRLGETKIYDAVSNDNNPPIASDSASDPAASEKAKLYRQKQIEAIKNAHKQYNDGIDAITPKRSKF